MNWCVISRVPIQMIGFAFILYKLLQISRINRKLLVKAEHPQPECKIDFNTGYYFGNNQIRQPAKQHHCIFLYEEVSKVWCAIDWIHYTFMLRIFQHTDQSPIRKYLSNAEWWTGQRFTNRYIKRTWIKMKCVFSLLFILSAVELNKVAVNISS